MFLDEVRFRVRSGAGGPGALTFRREKFVPNGGPDGGDGGRGGDVLLVASAGLSSLNHFQGRVLVAADRGGAGRKSLKHGADAAPVRLLVPVGTVAFDEATGDIIGELTQDGSELLLAHGGHGGRGNARFSTSRRQAPRFAELGEPGRELEVRLELRLIADVGLVGAPNAGKSTLLAALTAATPKVADYPFTTLEPNLGVLEAPDGQRLVLADVPGLIEGASRGSGLGTAFLKHLSRTSTLVHVLDISEGAAAAMAIFEAIQAELATFDAELPGRVRVVALNKTDIPGTETAVRSLRRSLGQRYQVVTISALAGEGLDPLVDLLFETHAASRKPAAPALRVYRPEPEVGPVRVQRQDGVYRIKGVRIERMVARTDLGNPDALERLQRALSAAGVLEALLQAGAGEGDTVAIGGHEFLFNPDL